MALDLGTLFATIDIKDDGWSQKIAKAKTDLTDLAKAAEDAAKIKINLDVTGTDQLDKAKATAESLADDLGKATAKKIDVAPTGGKDLDKAADSAKKLGEELDTADAKAPDVAPTGGKDLDKAKASAKDLGKELDTAGRKTVDVAPKGAGGLDRAADSAGDLGKELDRAGKVKPNIAPTGTGDVSRAADEASRLGKELESAKTSAKTFTIPPNLSDEVGAVGKATGGLVDKLGAVSGKAIKWGVMTAGASAAATAVGGVGLALTKGFQRLDSIDQANAKLTGLGHSAQEIEGIMDSAMASVKGTAFGFGEAAGLAGQMVASGIKPGEELTQVLTTVADTATIGGRSLEDMGLIFGSVAAKGKLQGDDLLQLMAGGIPVLQMLADETGKTAAEVSDMASNGEIDFATFESAMRNHLGGAAQAAGDTFSGAMDNAKAAAGRLGASFLEPMFKQAPGIIGGITDKLDEMGPAAAAFGEKAGAAMSDFAQGAIPHVKAALDTLKGSAETVWPVVQKIGDVAMGIPWQAYAGVVAMAVAKHQGLTDKLSAGSGKFKTFTDQVAANRSAMQQQGREIGVVSAAIQTLGQKSSTIGRMSQAFQSASTPLRIMGMDARETAKETTGLQKAALTAKGGLSSFGGVLSGTVAGGFSLAKDGAKGLMTALGGPWGLAIGGATAVIGTLIAKHQEAKAAEEEHKRAQQELRDSLDETTGAVTAQTEAIQIKKLEESGAAATARELGVSQDLLAGAATGNAQAMQEVNDILDRQTERAGASNSALQEHADIMAKMPFTYTDIVNSAAGMTEAQDKIRDGLDQVTAGMDSDTALKYRQAIGDIKKEIGDTEESAADLRGELGIMFTDVGDLTAEEMVVKLQNFSHEAEKAGEVSDALGDKVRKIGEDPGVISVEMNEAEFAKAKDKLDEIGVDYKFDGKTLDIQMPNGAGILETLDQIDFKLTFRDGRIDISSNSEEEKQKLVELGLAVVDEEGNITMRSDVQDRIQELWELKAIALDPVTGELIVSDNIDEVIAGLEGIDGTQTSGDHTQHDNVDSETRPNIESLNGEDTNSNHHVDDDAAAAKANVQGTMGSPSGDTQSKHTIQITAVGAAAAAAQIAAAGAGGVSFHSVGGRMPRNAEGSRLPRNAEGSRHGGYRLPTTGPGTGVVDGILGVDGRGVPSTWVDAGEWIINGDSSDRWDGTLAAINQGSPAAVIAAMLKDLESHANGGKTGSQRVKEQLGPYNNGQYIMGGFSPTQTDCSGAVSMGVNSYLGRDPFESRMSTVTEGQWLSERGFLPGRGDGNDLVVGWYDHGGGAYGHTAMQLPDGTYIESGGNTGQGLTIGGAAGPLDGRGFEQFMHLPADEENGEDGGLTGDLGDSSIGSYDAGDTYESGATPAGSYSGYSSGSTAVATPAMPETTVNGGNGTLIKDGSALEFAAAAMSTATGTPMPDNIVSWGQVMGTTTTRDQEETEAAIAQNERDKRANDRNIAATERELEAAREDAADKQEIYDAAAEGKGEEQAQKDLDEAKEKRAEAQKEYDEAEAKDKEKAQKNLDKADEDIEKKEKALRAVSDGKEAAAAKRDLDDANARIADLEDQLEVQRENSGRYESANDELRRSNLTPTSHRQEGSGPFGTLTSADRAENQDQITENERALRANDRDIEATERELEAAKEDVAAKEDDVTNASAEEERKAAERNLADAKDKVGELTDKLEGQRASSEQLRQSNQNLANSVDRLSLAMLASSVIDGVSSLAGGAMSMVPMADGGFSGSPGGLSAARSAQINEGSAVLWAEAGPEAYIPLSRSKSARSIDIWAETGKRLGIDAISAAQLLGSGIPGLMEGRTDGFSTGSSISLDAMGLNTDAAAYMIGSALASPVTAARTAMGGQSVTGAVFNGPVTISDPRAWAQGQANAAGQMLGSAMKGVML